MQSADSQVDLPVVYIGRRSGKLDVVMAHYDMDTARTAAMLYFWLNFLKTDKVGALGRQEMLPTI